MAYIQWPGTLPNTISWRGYRREIGNTQIRTPMDVGPPKVRARTSARIDRHDHPIVYMTKAQWLLLEEFYVTTLFGGVLQFEMTDPFTLLTQRYRFTEPPVFGTMLGPDTIPVTLKLEVFPP
jgi:hypothetical protein